MFIEKFSENRQRSAKRALSDLSSSENCQIADEQFPAIKR